jgi:hypothetical protein
MQSREVPELILDASAEGRLWDESMWLIGCKLLSHGYLLSIK